MITQITEIERFALIRKQQGHSFNKTCRNFKIHRTQLYRNFRKTIRVNGLSSIHDLLIKVTEAA